MAKTFPQLREEFKKVIGNSSLRDMTFSILMKDRLENEDQRREIARLWIEHEIKNVFAQEGVPPLELMRSFDAHLTWQKSAGVAKYTPDDLEKRMRDSIAKAFEQQFARVNGGIREEPLGENANALLAAIQSPPESMKPLMPNNFRVPLLDASLQVIQNIQSNWGNLYQASREAMKASARKLAEAGAQQKDTAAPAAETTHEGKQPIRFKIVNEQGAGAPAGPGP